MRNIFSVLKKINLPKIGITIVVGLALFLSTACGSNENMTASYKDRPNDIPVQAGANNNPYTMGNDTQGQPVPSSDYGNQAYKNQHSNSAIGLPAANLIATSVAGQDTTGLLYESDDQRQGGSNTTQPSQNRAYQPETIPQKRQPIIDRTDPDENILEGIGHQFTEASKFLTDGVQPAVESAKVKTSTGSNQSVAKQSDQDK